MVKPTDDIFDFDEYYKLKNDYQIERKNIIKKKIIDGGTKKQIKYSLSSSQKLNDLYKKINKLKKSVGFKRAHGNTYNLKYLLENQIKKVEAMKEKIIMLKLDLLFNYKTEDEVIAEITIKIPEFNRELELYKKYLLKYENIIQNTDNQPHLLDINEEIQIILMDIEKRLEHIRDNPSSGSGPGSSNSFREIITMYKEKLQFNPNNIENEENIQYEDEALTTRRMNLEYAYVGMYKKNIDDDEYYLIQKPYTISQLEITKA